jgi:hypothetical protein
MSRRLPVSAKGLQSLITLLGVAAFASSCQPPTAALNPSQPEVISGTSVEPSIVSILRVPGGSADSMAAIRPLGAEFWFTGDMTDPEPVHRIRFDSLSLAGVGLMSNDDAPLAGVYVHGHHAYVGGMSRGYNTRTNVGVRIVDLSDPETPALVGSIPLRKRGYFEFHSHGDAVVTTVANETFDGDVALVLDGVPDSFEPAAYPQPYGVWDVSDPSHPSFLSVVNLGRSPHGLEAGSLGDKPYDSKAVAGNYFFALYDASKRTHDFERRGWEDHLAVVDLSDPRNPIVVGDWHDDPAVWLSGVSLNESATRAYVTGFSGTAPSWVGNGYLYVLDVEDPTDPRELGRYVFPSFNVDVSIARPTADDQIVVLADHAWGVLRAVEGTPRRAPCGALHILDTSDPGSIHKISEFALPESSIPGCGRPNNWVIATDVSIRGSIVYSTWLSAGVRAVDISVPENPVEVGRFVATKGRSTSLSDIALLGEDYAVASTVWGSGLYVVRREVTTLPAKPLASGEPSDTPSGPAVQPNYPNPFNSDTVIRFDLPHTDDVELAVYNLDGQRVVTLVSGPHRPGAYSVSWDGRDHRLRELASGVYLFRFRVGQKTIETRRMTLVK